MPAPQTLRQENDVSKSRTTPPEASGFHTCSPSFPFQGWGLVGAQERERDATQWEI